MKGWITRLPRMRSSTRVHRMDLGTSRQNLPALAVVLFFVLRVPVVNVHFLVTLESKACYSVILYTFSNLKLSDPLPQFPGRNPP